MAASYAEPSGVISAVHIDYLRPSGAGDTFVATVNMPCACRERDLFGIHVADDEVVARANRRSRS